MRQHLVRDEKEHFSMASLVRDLPDYKGMRSFSNHYLRHYAFIVLSFATK